MFDLVAAAWCQRHVDGVGVAEEIVQIAEDFLVCARQENAQVVLVASDQWVQFDDVLDVETVDADLDVGTDLGSTVARDYFERRPFKFDGKIEKVAVELK